MHIHLYKKASIFDAAGKALLLEYRAVLMKCMALLTQSWALLTDEYACLRTGNQLVCSGNGHLDGIHSSFD